DVLRVAREYWHPAELSLVAVGNPKDFGKPLTALNLPVKPIDLTIPEPKEASNESEVHAGAQSLAQGKALLARLAAALGGVDKLASVKDTDWSADVVLETGPGGGMKAKQRNLFLLPNLFRQEQQLPFGKVTAYSDGKTGWIASLRGVMPMSAQVLHQVQGDMFRNLILLALSGRDPARTVTAVAPGTLEISGASGQRVKLVIDPRTGLPVNEIYQGAGMGGPAAVEETYSDWREVSGIEVPFKVTIEQGTHRAAGVTVTRYKVNTGLKPAALSMTP
ncbi:MAG: hypothetical protein ACREH9_12965, partial [Pseudomonadota bacterium]